MKYDNQPTLHTRISRTGIPSRVRSVLRPKLHMSKGEKSSQIIPARMRRPMRDYLAAGMFVLCSIIIVIACVKADAVMIDKVLAYVFTQFTLILNYYFLRRDIK